MTIHSHNRHSSNRHRRGGVLVWTAVLLPVLMSFVALCVDVGVILFTKSELQATADIASLSGAIELPNTTDARAAAVAVVTANDASAGAAMQTADVVFGNWNRDTRTFTAGGTPTDAIQVRASRDTAHSNALPLFFAPIFGSSFADVEAVGISWITTRLGGPVSGGLVGLEWAEVGGTALIDGYDPTAGPYGGTNAGLPGTVLSNGTMTVRGTPVVTGDARPGVSYTEADVRGNSTVGGSVAALTKPLDFAPVVIPTSINAGANDNSQVTSTGNPINGSNTFDDSGPPETVTNMPSGDYYFSDMNVKRIVNITGPATVRVSGDLHINSQAAIYVDGGPVQFFIEGSGQLNGQGIVNLSQDPSMLTIQSTGPSLHWNGDSDFYGYLYAPFDSAITINGTADFYGGAVGRTLTISGTGDVHTDRGAGFEGPNRPLPLLVD